MSPSRFELLSGGLQPPALPLSYGDLSSSEEEPLVDLEGFEPPDFLLAKQTPCRVWPQALVDAGGRTRTFALPCGTDFESVSFAARTHQRSGECRNRTHTSAFQAPDATIEHQFPKVVMLKMRRREAAVGETMVSFRDTTCYSERTKTYLRIVGEERFGLSTFPL